MMRQCLLLFALTAGCAASNDAPPVPTFSDGKADGATTPACSLEWWSWLNQTYLPMLDRPAAEVSADDLRRAAAAAPDMGETPMTYGLCYQGAVDKYIFAAAAKALHDADVTYVDQSSPDFQKYSAYLAHAAPSPEIIRNAAALATIKPHLMDATAYSTWVTAYSSLLAEEMPPIGLPGPMLFENIQEPEWTFDAPDDAYAAMLESVLVPSNKDGSLDAWLETYQHWLIDGDISNSYVFNIDHTFGCSGVELDASGWYLPAPVRGFLDRYQATRPKAIGESDWAKWMSLYHGYGLRLVGDIGNDTSYGLDDLMLQTIEEVKPDNLAGLFPYQTWLELAALSEVATDATLHARFGKAKPCVTPADLEAANASFATSGAPADAAPATCSP
jgi:hypothetical protein